ncbi:PilW family protein [Nitrincola alkalilacustris]|uniref:PilW family protein n=1 Tax=Nitrincola alkalilacustris TaxID=1571224 RepID=UPI001456804A|nr:PilW family protein [Nitrincola alkalilacustris]
MIIQDIQNTPRPQRGFTIVEVMIALTAGLIIMLALTEVFTNNSRTRGELEKTNRQIENGRYAMLLLTNELSNAGFFGEAGNPDPNIPPLPSSPTFTNNNLTCPTDNDEIEILLNLPLFGENNTTSAPSCLTGFKSGNDFLTIRRSSTCVADSGDGCDPFLANAHHLQVSACQTDDPGSIQIGTSLADMTLLARDCSNPAPIYRLLNRTYFITSNNVLSRAELGAGSTYTVTPLVDGIEALHFEYGIDNNGNGEPNLFTNTPALTDLSDVVALRVWILVRSLEPSPGHLDNRTYTLGGETPVTFNDNIKRQLYSTTVRINNIAGRREEP